MIRQILREEGIREFYKGFSASYLGVTESTIQWVLYERLKRLTTSTQGAGGQREWAGMLASVGTAMCVASLITYPHEVRHLNTFFWIIGLTYYLIVSSSNAATTTPHEWDEKIYKLNPDHLPCHRRRERTIIVWWPEHASHARCAVMYFINEGILRWGGTR